MNNNLTAAMAVAALAFLPVRSPAGIAGPSFVTVQGDVSQEAVWQTAVGGSIPIENFESFAGVPNTTIGGDALTALPGLRVHFDTPVPGVYVDSNFAHSGTNQWCNWAAGAGNSSGHVLRVDCGYAIRALGFWQCDPQGSQSMDAYGFNGAYVGTIVGQVNSHRNDPANSDGFAGFISDTPIEYVVIPGNFGDGWNHFDDLQVATEQICQGDTDINGVVDINDLLAVLAAWGTPDADVDCDDLTDVADLLLVLGGWGGCAAGATR